MRLWGLYKFTAVYPLTEIICWGRGVPRGKGSEGEQWEGEMAKQEGKV